MILKGLLGTAVLAALAAGAAISVVGFDSAMTTVAAWRSPRSPRPSAVTAKAVDMASWPKRWTDAGAAIVGRQARRGMRSRSTKAIAASIAASAA